MRLGLCRWTVLPLLWLGAAVAHANGHCPERLRVGTLDYALPPYITESGEGQVDETPGQLMQWLREALLHLGCTATRIQVQRLPVWRGYEFLKSGEIDLWAPTTVSEQSQEAGVFAMRGERVNDALGFARARYSFYVQKGTSDIHWDGKSLSGAPDKVLGVSNATAAVQFARGRGFATESATNINLTINKLLAGKIQVALVPDLSVQVRADADQARLERLEPEAMTVWFHAMFNREFARQRPRFTAGYWQALCQASRKSQPELPRCP